MIKIFKKNPAKLHVDDYFLDLLSEAISEDNIFKISHAISYLHVGKKCTDCKQIYFNCMCEGRSENYYEKFPKYTKSKISAPCEECYFNRCLCDYLDKDGKLDIDKTIMKIINKYLIGNKIQILKNKLQKTNTLNAYKFLDKNNL